MRKAETIDHWNDELYYIDGISAVYPGDEFNNDPECFMRYCEMQARFARLDGFEAIADSIQSRADDALLAALGV